MVDAQGKHSPKVVASVECWFDGDYQAVRVQFKDEMDQVFDYLIGEPHLTGLLQDLMRANNEEKQRLSGKVR